MTEEIIIDGVNVWSCKHYDLENNYCDQSYLGEGGLLKNTKNPKRCGCNPNCYYKQFKRLEQENKELKEQAQLDGECIDKLIEARDIYAKALEEIREIATNYFEECGVPDDYFKRNNYSWKQHQIKAFTCKLQQIIDIAKEVLGNENN